MNAPWEGWPACPCGCGTEGLKLQQRHDQHIVGCSCRSCIGRRNRRKGQAGEARRHRRLGGTGTTPRDELAQSYSLNVTTEDKTGNQIPVSYRTFVTSEWFRHAMRQAEKKLPIGSDAMPALYLELGHQGAWLVVKVPTKGLR